MANAKDRQRWAAMDRRAERDGLSDWQAEQRTDDDRAIRDALELTGEQARAEVLRAFMLYCLPPKAYGAARRFQSGYYRMVALAWRLMPDLLDGCRTDADVALRLRISPVAFCRHLARVDSLLAARRRAPKSPNDLRDV